MKKRVFLDYASTTPLDPKVFREMKPYLSERFENPSSLYEEGMSAKRAIENARKEIADLVHARPQEIIFTGSGTESINLAILGLFESVRNHFESRNKVPHIITTAIEHPAVLETCREVESRGGKVTYVLPEENGIVDPKKIRDALTPETILVTVMYANNEIGTLQPIAEIGKMIRRFKNDERKSAEVSGKNGEAGLEAHEASETFFPFFHTDASQAANYCDINREKLGVDLMTLDGSKIYGPKGVGVLYKKEIVPLRPIIFGGGQEKGLRSGTENVAAIVGMAAALRIAQNIKEKESSRVRALRDYCISEVVKLSPAITLNGDPVERLPNNVSICVPDHDGEFMVIQADAAGIAVASVSACKNLSEKTTSYVIEALGEQGQACAGSSLRISLGRETTKRDIDAYIAVMKKILSNTQ